MSNQTEEKQHERISAIAIIVFVVVFGSMVASAWLLMDLNTLRTKAISLLDKESEVPQPTLTVLIPTQRLRNLIDSLPEDSTLRSNLTIVLVAEYCSDTNNLNELLTTYAEFKIKQLEEDTK